MTQSKRKDNLFYHISHSHLYWGRKPTSGLAKIFENLKPGDVLLDPFCGGGSSIIAALKQGSRVIASDLNPMAVFISKVLVQPVSIFSLKESFEIIRKLVAESILKRYTISCPRCNKDISFEFIKWKTEGGTEIPEAVKVNCRYCGFNQLSNLSNKEIARQLELSAIKPNFWFPSNPINTQRKSKAEFVDEFFTGRNLTSLSDIFHTIRGIDSIRCRETFQYIFTAMLYSCSLMQMWSKKEPSSSRGWTAPRFYIPPMRQEKNVWRAFENRFLTVLNAKEVIVNQVLNKKCHFIRLSNSIEQFENSDENVFIYQADFLNFLFPKKIKISHVFLDPPYNDDIDYIEFSKFWTSWLGLSQKLSSSWHPGLISNKENSNKFYKLLSRVKENTDSSCLITLAYGSKKPAAWEALKNVISQVGYEIIDHRPIIWDNSQKRDKQSLPNDKYFILKKMSKKAKSHHIKTPLESSDKIIFYIKVAACLLPDIKNPEMIIDLVSNLIKPNLKVHLKDVINKDLIKEIMKTENKGLNCKAYNRLVFILLKKILSTDGFQIIAADHNKFDHTHINGFDDIKTFPKQKRLLKGADFLAQDGEGKKIFFCFYEKENNASLRLIAENILKNDNDKFREIYYLIFNDENVMTKCRDVALADNWPRGFFISFNKIVEKVKELKDNRFTHLTLNPLKSNFENLRAERKIENFKAKVIRKMYVEREDPDHFIIRFHAPKLKYIVPGQFVMVDTLPYNKRKQYSRYQPLKTLSNFQNHSSKKNIIDLTPKSFLKRPFSIHRAFYKHFQWDYLKNMSLPPKLASITHTVFPDTFEIFFKLIKDGTGTHEFREIEEKNTFQILGPLGKVTTIANWRSEGFEEVHLIGGGVGMAPLMFFGQALKYYSFKLKAFIGIDSLDTLLFKEPFAQSFDEKDPYAYIKNLKLIGLKDNEIYVSYEIKVSSRENFLEIPIPKKNIFQGYVSKQYLSYIEKLANKNKILVLTCGPKPMLIALNTITSNAQIPMKVLMEKRMGCGIGVCMSCVCKTKKNNIEQYSRVCVEGPLFDAKDIVW